MDTYKLTNINMTLEIISSTNELNYLYYNVNRSNKTADEAWCERVLEEFNNDIHKSFQKYLGIEIIRLYRYGIKYHYSGSICSDTYDNFIHKFYMNTNIRSFVLCDLIDN